MDEFRHRSAEQFCQAFAALAQELGMKITTTYLEAHQPKLRDRVTIRRESSIVGTPSLGVRTTAATVTNVTEIARKEPVARPDKGSSEVNVSVGAAQRFCLQNSPAADFFSIRPTMQLIDLQ